MDQDTVDQTKKSLEDLYKTLKGAGKGFDTYADKVKEVTKQFNNASITMTKTATDLEGTMKLVSDAFDAPINAFERLMDTGVESGDHLLQTFGALAGLMFDSPIKAASDKVKQLEEDLSKIPLGYDDQLQKGNDVIKNLEDRITKEKDLCKKKSQCSEDAIKNLEDQIKLEKDKLDEAKKIGPEDAANNKKKRDDLLAQKKVQEENLAKLQMMAKVAKEFIAIFKDGFDRFVQLDKAAASFRKELGLGRDNARSLEQTALQLNQQFATLGVTIDNAYKALTAIGKTLGTSLLVNKELATTTTLLAANYGVSETNAAGFLQKMNAIGGMTDKQASAMAGFTANLANAAGVNIDEVMGDVANASDETLTLMRGNVKQMTLAAVQARMMGVSLDKSAASAKGLLNFTQSVSDEMEASVLLGKNLNLNAARQLSFAGDVAGAQKEILNQVRQMGDLNKMNVFQQEALAKATGYSVADLTKMLANEEKLAKLSDKERQSLEKAQQALKEQNEETGKQLLMRTQMQSAMAQLSNTFQTFKQIMADILTPVVNVAVKLLIPVLKLALVLFNFMLIPVKILANALYKMWEPIEPIVQKLNDALDGANSYVETIVQGATDLGVILIRISTAITLGLLKPFSMVFNLVGSLGSRLSSIGGIFGLIVRPVSSVLSFISRIGTAVVSLITRLGTIEVIFTTTASVFSRISSFATGLLGPISGITSLFGSAAGTVGKFASGFARIGKIVSILTAAGKAIPFVGQVLTIIQAVWGFFSRIMGGMNVFQALGETLYDVFIGPFEMLFELLGKIPVIGVVFQQVSKIFPYIKTAITDVFGYFQKGWESIKELFSGKDIGQNLLNIGKMILSGMYLVPMILLKALMAMFPNVIDKLKSLFTIENLKSVLSGIFSIPMFIIQSFDGIGPIIMSALKGLGSLMYDLLIQPWVSLWNFVSGLFSGGGSSKVGNGIIEGLLGVAGMILKIFMDPFQSIFDLVIKGFTSIGSLIQTVLSAPFKIVGKLIGVDTGGIDEAATTSNAEGSSDVISAIEQTNQKLDTLISLMMNGGIAVNLDGRKVSEQLAIASS